MQNESYVLAILPCIIIFNVCFVNHKNKYQKNKCQKIEQEQRRLIGSQECCCSNTMTKIEKNIFLVYSLKDTIVKTIKGKENNPIYNKMQ